MSQQLIFTCGLLLSSLTYAAELAIHHALKIKLNPSEHFIKVDDKITFDNRSTVSPLQMTFALHCQLILKNDTAKQYKPAHWGPIPVKFENIPRRD